MNQKQSPVPLSADTREQLMQVSVATQCTVLFKRGFRNQTLQDVHPVAFWSSA